MSSQSLAEVSNAFSILQRAVQQSAQGTPAIVQLLERIALQTDRLVNIQEQLLSSMTAQEATTTRMQNLHASWQRKEGPYKIVRSIDGRDPTAQPHNLPGLWYISSLQSLSMEQAKRYLEFYGFSVSPDISPMNAKQTIAAECGMAPYTGNE